MATVAALPNSLYDKIDSLARRMALLRLLRVAAGTVLLLTLVAGLIILADAWLRFGLAMRLGFLAGWLVLAVAGIIKCVNALGRKADVDSLAALIENEYPNLAERLTSSVELAEAGTASHGSPTLISLLIRETEIRTSKLNFLQA